MQALKRWFWLGVAGLVIVPLALLVPILLLADAIRTWKWCRRIGDCVDRCLERSDP